MALVIAVDFDGTVVLDRPGKLVLRPGAKEGLQALKRAGHVLLLWSARSNRALREDWRLNPLWLTGVLPLRVGAWERERPTHEASYQAMLAFVQTELEGLFDAVDDGVQGKPLCDLFIDDKTLAGHTGVDWSRIAGQLGVRHL